MKRKISLQKLAEEMPILNVLDQAHMIGGGDGSYSNPFTQLEVDALINSGSFYGGYVQDGSGEICYWISPVTVYGTNGYSGYCGYGQNANISDDYFYLPQNGASFRNGDCSYVNIGYGYGGLDFLIDFINHCDETATGIKYGAGNTQVGDNFKLYYETKTGRVFCGNQYVGTTSLKGLAKTAEKVFGPISFLASAYNVGYDLYNNGTTAAAQTAVTEASTWACSMVGAKYCALAGCYFGPVGGLVGGIAGALGGAVLGEIGADYIIELSKQ